MIIKNESASTKVVAAGVERRILATDGKLMAVEVKFRKGGVGALHSHPHEQVSYIVAGSFEFEMNGKKEVIKAGDSYYVKPNISHGIIALEDAVILDVFTPQREDFLP